MYLPRIRRIAAMLVATASLGTMAVFATAASASADADIAGSSHAAAGNVVTPAVSGSTIASIAQSQVGHGPCQSDSPYSGTGYNSSCNGEEWCSDFAKWVWATAGADVTGLSAAAGSFGLYGNGLHANPQVGDAAVFGYGYRGAGTAEHVVIVTRVSGSTFYDVGGNENGRVQADGPISSAIGNTQFGQALSGFVTPQGAASTKIDSWVPGSTCHNAGHQFCLWYAQGKGTGGAGWGSSGSVSTISGTFTIGGSGAAGYGQAVRNNAASMTNATTNCNVTVWYSPNYAGAFNWLSPNHGGNLTAALRNNDASISANNCG